MWAESEEKHGTLKIYAVSGIKGSIVQKDETISESHTKDGHRFWKILFAQGEKEAKLRIQVTAEDGTRKNIYLTLKLTDKTAPVLKKVSASRISTDKASVVYKTSEKGYRYYKVVDAGKKIPSLKTSGKGTEIQAGTDTITLTGLTAGEKDLVVAVKDGSGNISKQLVIRIPDIRNPGNGNANGSGKNNGVINRPGSGGHKSEAVKPGNGSDGEGSKAKLKKVSGTGSGSQGEGSKENQKKENKKNSKEKKKDSRQTEEEKKSAKTDKKKSEEISKEKTGSEETKDSETGSSEDAGTAVETGSGTSSDTEEENQTVSAQLKKDWKEAGVYPKILLLIALLSAAYLLFWYRARKHYQKNSRTGYKQSDSRGNRTFI